MFIHVRDCYENEDVHRV